jgi:hypothetical protein
MIHLHKRSQRSPESFTDDSTATTSLKENDLWSMVDLQRRQFYGIRIGSDLASHDAKLFRTSAAGVDLTEPVSIWSLQLINFLGDLFDIKPATIGAHRQDFSTMAPSEASAFLQVIFLGMTQIHILFP